MGDPILFVGDIFAAPKLEIEEFLRMEQPRFPNRRRNNYGGASYRIYSNPPEQDLYENAQHVAYRSPKEEFGTQAGFATKGLKKKELGPTKGGDGDELKRAAAVLAKSGALLFEGLCESCSGIVRERLAILSSGGSLEVPAINPDGHASDASPPKSDGKIQVAENEKSGSVGNSPPIRKDQAEQVTNFEKPQQWGNAVREEANGQTRLHVPMPAVSNKSMDNLTAKMASHSLAASSPYKPEGKTGPLTKTGMLEVAGANEVTRIQQIKRKKDFVSMERVDGKTVNVVEGLELHTNVFTDAEQKALVNFIYGVQEAGRAQKLRKRTYSEPRKWMRGKGRVTIQFGCCYNYAVDRDGNPPGIIQDEEVDPMPDMLRAVIKRLVRWHVLPPNSVPDSCIINLYDVGDCIPPHIDHHDFVRPFCTVSLLSECAIVFGSKLNILGPGDFLGTISIPLPTGSVLVLNGNGADVAMHAVPAVPTQRISITFRKMDPSKVPTGFAPDLELLHTEPLMDSVSKKQASKVHPAEGALDTQLKMQTSKLHPAVGSLDAQPVRTPQKTSQNGASNSPLFVLEADFPTLDSSAPGRKHRKSGS